MTDAEVRPDYRPRAIIVASSLNHARMNAEVDMGWERSRDHQGPPYSWIDHQGNLVRYVTQTRGFPEGTIMYLGYFELRDRGEKEEAIYVSTARRYKMFEIP